MANMESPADVELMGEIEVVFIDQEDEDFNSPSTAELSSIGSNFTKEMTAKEEKEFSEKLDDTFSNVQLTDTPDKADDVIDEVELDEMEVEHVTMSDKCNYN